MSLSFKHREREGERERERERERGIGREGIIERDGKERGKKRGRGTIGIKIARAHH